MSSTATVLGTAIWADDRNTFKRELAASHTVEFGVGVLQQDICKHVSAVYGLNPPLSPFDMPVRYFPSAAEPTDPLSICSSPGLTTITIPNAETARRIQTHLANRAQANQTSVEHNTTLATDSESATTSFSTAAAPSRKSKNRKKRNTASKANPSSTDNPPLTANPPQMTMDSQLMDMLASMKTEIGSMRNEMESMRNKNERILNENGSMRNEIENIRSKNERILTENARILGENARILGENGSMRNEIESMRDENERISNENERVLNENESIRNDLVKLHKDLKAEKVQRAQDHEALIQITALLVPLRLRVLLDLARNKVLIDLGYETWEELRASRSIHQLAEDIHNDLKRKTLKFHPSSQSIFFLCAYNNIRRAGNVAAHSAEQCDIKSAVESQPLDSNDRRCLEHLFRYAYNDGALI